MKVIFFLIDARDAKRYYLDVLPDVLENADVTILIEGSEEATNLHEMGIKFPIQVMGNKSITQLEEMVGKADVLFINGQRIPDIVITLLAHRIGVKVAYLQHGMYIPYMKRNAAFFLKDLYKSWRYAKYSMIASKVDENSKLLFSLIRSHLIDGVRDYKFRKYDGFPDISLVFSEYWAEWHKEHYFNSEYDQFSIVGNPEPTRFEPYEFGSEYITYCYQTLIEDGRIEKKYLLNKIDEIIDWTTKNNKNLIVKTHPRMSEEVQDYLESRKVQLVLDKLPVTDIVIGHYSSLMPLWAYYGSTVFSLELKDHCANIDESIEKTSISISSLDQIAEYSHNSVSNENRIKKNVKYYFNYDMEYSSNVWEVLSGSRFLQKRN